MLPPPTSNGLKLTPLLDDARVVPQNIRHRNHADDGSILRHGQMAGGLFLHHAHGIDNRPIAFNGHHRCPHAGFDEGRIGIQPIGHYLAGQSESVMNPT